MLVAMTSYTLEADIPAGIVLGGREAIMTYRAQMLVGPGFYPRYDDWVELLRDLAKTPVAEERLKWIKMLGFLQEVKVKYDYSAQNRRNALVSSGGFPRDDKRFLDVGTHEGETVFLVESWNPCAAPGSTYSIRVIRHKIPVQNRSALVEALSFTQHDERMKVFSNFCCVCGVNTVGNPDGNFCVKHRDDAHKFVLTPDAVKVLRQALTGEDCPETRPFHRAAWFNQVREQALTILTPRTEYSAQS